MNITFRSFGLTLALVIACLLLPACATLNPDYEEPTVTMTSFRAIPAEGVMPTFEIGLRIINPNPAPLNLEGVVYSISLQEHELIKGVGKDYPQIEGYSEGDITLTASSSMLKSIQFITDLVKNQDEPLTYEFRAKLDLAGLHPSLKISETGSFKLGN